MKRYSILLWLFTSAIFSVAVLGMNIQGYAVRAQTIDNQDQADNIQSDINKLQKKLEAASKKKDALVQDLNTINTTLTSTQRVIAQTARLLQETTQTIGQKEEEIANLERQLDLERNLLKSLLQELYLSKSTPLAEIILSGDDVASLFRGDDSLLSTQDRLHGVIQDIDDMKARVTDEKASLEDTKKDHETLIQLKNRQKQSLVAAQVDTQSDIEDAQSIINRLNKELSELQGDLSKILGKSYNAKDIKDAVEFASKVTGVPRGFLFGVLKMETNLGANVGGCTYAQVEDGAEANYKKGKLGKRAWATFQYRRDLFKVITKELGIDYRKQKVSCNPSGYAGTGGAMGVAQFMPDTWNGYKSAVASETGHNPPSPWNLTDGVVAMALKLDRVPGVDDGNRSAWKKAAAAYLGTSYAPYINGILYWADHYKELL